MCCVLGTSNTSYVSKIAVKNSWWELLIDLKMMMRWSLWEMRIDVQGKMISFFNKWIWRPWVLITSMPAAMIGSCINQFSHCHHASWWCTPELKKSLINSNIFSMKLKTQPRADFHKAETPPMDWFHATNCSSTISKIVLPLSRIYQVSSIWDQGECEFG